MTPSCVLADILLVFFFFFNDPATTEIYTLSLHDALPISKPDSIFPMSAAHTILIVDDDPDIHRDRKSTRLNSSHSSISYAVFCLKKKKNAQDRLLHIQLRIHRHLTCSWSLYTIVLTQIIT